MLRTILVFLFIIVILHPLQLHAQSLLHTEILGRPTDTGITVQLLFAEPAELRVQYGTSSGNYSDSSDWKRVQADEAVFVELRGLQPNSPYVYRVNYRKQGAGTFSSLPERRFHTQRRKGSAFRFTVQADPHCDEQSDTSLYRICLQNQLADSPDFMIDLGDVIMSDKLKNSSGKVTRDTINKRTHFMRSYYETSCHSIPLFLALGNHEGECGWLNNGTPENIAVWNTLERTKYFPNPLPDGFYSGDTTTYPFVGRRSGYYSWTWGDALFIVLDPYWFTKPKPDSLNGWRWTLGKAQYDWLKRTLETKTCTFTFVFAHQLVGGDPDGRGGVEFADKYEWGGKNLNGTDGFAQNRPGWYKPLKDLFTEHRVTIFFHGHDHFFAKQDKNCLVYQLTPQPSHPNFSGAGQADDYGYFEGQILPNSGHLRVSVSPQAATVEYVRAYIPQNETSARKNKDVAATYTIGARNCYDSMMTSVPVLWNAAYTDELIYPNPSAGVFTIRFTVAESQHITITVYDAQGKTVRCIMNDMPVADGEFTVFWDGRNSSSEQMPAGTYTYVVRSAERGKVSSGTMVLVR
ncbi:MAG: metallophosphoesterase [Candidatus Kapabacteria bacterium]|nr:metallophosphoesterase [Candidatus Kapabacteria bacterium]